MRNLRLSQRNNTEQRSKSRLRSILEQRGRKSIWNRSKLSQSKLLQQIRCHTQTIESQQKQKDIVYNKNITHFRESFHPSDSHMLPFLSSLRQTKDYRQEKAMGLTTLQPFDVSTKQTLNQKVKKNINDMLANPFRLSKINYRWNGNSGLGIKTNCEFQCTLRLNKNLRNPEQSTFYNTIEPIRYRTVEERRYELKELVCSRQKKLFTLAQ